MHLYIAEKPSLGRAIAAALPQPQQKGQGWIRCGSGSTAVTVSWCIGHLLEPAEPASYNPAWKSWRADQLPMFPEKWQLTPKTGVAAQLKVLQSLICKASKITHAGDPDREGQLLVDEVIRYVGTDAPVRRLLINDLTPAAVTKALTQTRDNRDFHRLSESALARQRADWLYGLNLTRFYTLLYQKKGQQQGEQGVYSVGRVQTPVLGLVVKRDQHIEKFHPQDFFPLEAHFHGMEEDSDTRTFTARWVPGEDYQHLLDSENRMLDRSAADQVAAAIDGRPGKICESRFRDRPEPPPLPLSLSALQIEAGRLFRMGAKEVLDTAQSLYERHQLITYPRSDSRYLPLEHYNQRQQIVSAIGNVDSGLASACNAADLQRKTAVWNDKKVDAHHAIIPTSRSRTGSALSAKETQIYNLISRYYLMQFAADAIHREGKLGITVGNHLFRTSETAVFQPGWKSLELKLRDAKTKAEKPPLPRLGTGDPVLCDGTQVLQQQTQPPKHFSDATLLGAITNIARFVNDPELRKTLRETDGLGTEATRAAILETLFKRGYMIRDGRHIRASDKGKTLIDALPDSVSKPDRTAVWEATLEAIQRGEAQSEQFLDSLKQEIRGFVGHPTPLTSPAPEVVINPDAPHCPKCRAGMIERKGKFGAFFACTRYPGCKGTRPLEDHTPEDGSSQKPVPCPFCFSPLVRRKSKKGWFWGCSSFPACRQTVNDVNGKPDLPIKPAT